MPGRPIPIIDERLLSGDDLRKQRNRLARRRQRFNKDKGIKYTKTRKNVDTLILALLCKESLE